ncbi:hypothetical protein [Moellerella wisconsensis]|uniref:hypothetical protein n=1 Tax=Moellerella wisconsensis TaxID=158849 RepID=UPI0024104A16|nr:hypothetical protein [Moellerella wisconsensis]
MRLYLSINELELMINLIKQYHEYDSSHTSDALIIKLQQELTHKVALKNAAALIYNSVTKRGVE